MTTPGVEPGLSRPRRDVLATRRCGRINTTTIPALHATPNSGRESGVQMLVDVWHLVNEKFTALPRWRGTFHELLCPCESLTRHACAKLPREVPGARATWQRTPRGTARKITLCVRGRGCDYFRTALRPGRARPSPCDAAKVAPRALT